jgi:hypothetical protein
VDSAVQPRTVMAWQYNRVRERWRQLSQQGKPGRRAVVEDGRFVTAYHTWKRRLAHPPASVNQVADQITPAMRLATNGRSCGGHCPHRTADTTVLPQSKTRRVISGHAVVRTPACMGASPHTDGGYDGGLPCALAL